MDPKRVQKLSGAQLAAVGMLPPFDGVITSATTLVTEAPTAEASSTGAVPDVATDAIAPGTSAPPPIRAAFFRLVHAVKNITQLTSAKERKQL